jgi:hypothetical protein
MVENHKTVSKVLKLASYFVQAKTALYAKIEAGFLKQAKNVFL